MSLDIDSMDLKFHTQKAYYVLENSKFQIKTNYLNYFALEETVLPNIL